MASLLKKKNKWALTKGKILGGLGLGGLVLAFFFLPELLQLGKESKDSKKPSEIAKISEKLDEAAPALIGEGALEESQQEEEPLEPDSDHEAAQLEQVAVVEAPTPEAKAVDCAHCPPVQPTPEPEPLLIPRDGPVTWQNLSTPEVKQLLVAAQAKANEIVKSLDPRYQNTRYHLVTFIRAVQLIQAGEKNGVLNAEESLEYLVESDIQVSDTMALERVPRDNRLQWSQVSIAPLLRSAIAARRKQQIVGPFEPRLRITKLILSYEWVNERSRYPQAPLIASFEGMFVGNDVARLEFALSRERYPDFQPLGFSLPDKFGRVTFYKWGLSDVKKAPLILRAISKDGQVYEKRYDFFSRAHRFAVYLDQHTQQFTYRIPFKVGDPRLDATFLIGTRRFLEEDAIRAMLQAQGFLETNSSSPIVEF